jgi:hypothetical protein
MSMMQLCVAALKTVAHLSEACGALGRRQRLGLQPGVPAKIQTEILAAMR